MTSWPGPGWQGPPPRYLQPLSDHRAYAPPWQQHSPQGWYSPDAYRLQVPVPVPVTSPSATNTHSPKYPSLNPVLAEDTTLLRFDVKIKPTSSSSILTSVYNTHRHHYALAKATTHMRLVSKAFPWQIDIVSQTNVTCEDVWNSLYSALQEPIADSEWGFIIKEKDQVATIQDAVKQRLEKDKMSDKKPLRIDYLGDTTLFRGLEKDDDYAKLRLLPHAKRCEETWVVKLMS
ncbi:hypothetical protein GALMADRAFT_258196 [Galerina marginata CBS 339.88]|uniref:DUF6699 domain-containing protein n=1 Tax=Galerina marginata (strain CBS 339.88) TaxID=685588 RepID=A0A067S9G6_GALM3|nr:hypothetical protein GALMADRAFT_258196 [Galerina marginata CBS 339.88]